MKKIIHNLAPWALPVLLLAVWQLSVSAGWLSTRILPAPIAVIEAGVSLVSSGEIWTHLAISGWRAALGFAIGGGIGLQASRTADPQIIEMRELAEGIARRTLKSKNGVLIAAVRNAVLLYILLRTFTMKHYRQ